MEIKKEYPEPKGIVQIYPALEFHGEVVIIGDKEALENLAQTLKSAIENNKSQAEVWASDGEGYQILIRCVKEGWENKVWEDLPNHYTAEWINKDCKRNPTQVWIEGE